MIEQTIIDIELINAAIIGRNDSAWATVYRSYFPRLFQFIKKYFWQLDDETIRDLVQLSLIKAATTGSKQPFSNMKHFDSWILQIARNSVYDYLERASTKSEFLMEIVEDISQFEEEAPSKTDSPALAQKVKSALESLKEQDRKLLEMRVNGVSFAIIAKELGIKENVARTYYGRAKEKFKYAYNQIVNGKAT